MFMRFYTVAQKSKTRELQNGRNSSRLGMLFGLDSQRSATNIVTKSMLKFLRLAKRDSKKFTCCILKAIYIKTLII